MEESLASYSKFQLYSTPALLLFLTILKMFSIFLVFNYLRAKFMIHMSYRMHNPLGSLSVDRKVLTMLF